LAKSTGRPVAEYPDEADDFADAEYAGKRKQTVKSCS
jgi:hypothetical protein